MNVKPVGRSCSIVIVILTAFGVVSPIACAQTTDSSEVAAGVEDAEFGGILGVFDVPDDRYTNDDHYDAEILIFKSRLYPKKKVGLIFYQRLGDHEKSGFVCDDALKSGSGESTAFRCVNNYVDEKGNPVLEMLTVGRLKSEFCEDMRAKYNTPEENKMGKGPIYKDDHPDCRGVNKEGRPKKCVCYEIESWPPEVVARETPPGNGAGSGGSH